MNVIIGKHADILADLVKESQIIPESEKTNIDDFIRSVQYTNSPEMDLKNPSIKGSYLAKVYRIIKDLKADMDKKDIEELFLKYIS